MAVPFPLCATGWSWLIDILVHFTFYIFVPVLAFKNNLNQIKNQKNIYRHLMQISEAGYERTRRACAPCAVHLSAGAFSCPTRYAVAIATPNTDHYHRHAAVRHLSAAMEAAAKKTKVSSSGGSNAGDISRIVGPLAAIERVHGGPPAFFAALVPMLSAEVGGWVKGW